MTTTTVTPEQKRVDKRKDISSNLFNYHGKKEMLDFISKIFYQDKKFYYKSYENEKNKLDLKRGIDFSTYTKSKRNKKIEMRHFNLKCAYHFHSWDGIRPPYRNFRIRLPRYDAGKELKDMTEFNKLKLLSKNKNKISPDYQIIVYIALDRKTEDISEMDKINAYTMQIAVSPIKDILDYSENHIFDDLDRYSNYPPRSFLVEYHPPKPPSKTGGVYDTGYLSPLWDHMIMWGYNLSLRRYSCKYFKIKGNYRDRSWIRIR